MDRLKRKELELLKQQKELKLLEHKNMLKSIIKSHQTLQITLKFAQQHLTNDKIDSLSEYSPVQISRLVFDQQLQQIQQQFMKLPDHEAYIEHFIVIMLKVMKFPFEKCPLYMVGLKDMFYQIAEEEQQTINYHQLFKYILGELVTMKEEEQNTEFQVRLTERKKQDYLLHDNGIKRIYYSNDLKMMMSLDERSNMIKMYDQDMKNVNKFSPKKEKHHNKFPIILDFDYSEITERLGMVLSDDTLTTVSLTSLLQKNQVEFEANPMNEVVFALPEKMRRIFFVQMMNKWLTVTDEGNKLFLFDMERIRTQPEKVQSRLRLNLNDQDFTCILEVVSLSCICLVAGNEVNFYNQNFSQVKFKKFTHCETIKQFKYSDQKNQFYLCGLQKNITIFSINRAGFPSKIWTFPTNKIITDFQVFPFFDTIVVADENHDLKLIHETTRNVYQQISYGHIVKSKGKTLGIGRISKNQFALFQTYMIVLTQEKTAIERDIEYSFLPYHYYDEQKQELYLSVNNQIISFSLLSGEIRKNYSLESSNIQKHHCIFIAHKCPLFILDHDFNIYEVYQRDQLGQGENKNYRKKINIQQVLSCFYDTDLRTFIAVNKNSFMQVRNDKNNNFNVLNTVNLEGFSKIVSSTFCQQSKTLTFLMSDQLVYQLKNYNYHIDNCYRFVFPRDQLQHEDHIISGLHYDYYYDIFVLLSNKNQVYFVQRDGDKQIYFNITQNLPPKLKQLKFTACRYQLVKEKKELMQPFILLVDDSGFLVQFSMLQIFQQYKLLPKMKDYPYGAMFKDTQTITNEGIETKIITLKQEIRLKKSYSDIGLLRAHEKQIALALKIKIQVLTTLTVAIDGCIRLWSATGTMLFSLKIPSLVKLVWNMKQIQQVKNKKSIDELLSIFKNHYAQTLQEHSTPSQICSKSKKLKYRSDPPKINFKDPIKLEFQSKDIEEIVMQKEEYRTHYSKDKNKTTSFFQTTGKIYPHPWRKRKQFIQLYQKASPPHKYKQKMPDNLIEMRNCLDMREKIVLAPDYKEAERILPQLTLYQPEKFYSQRKREQNPIQNEEEGETFESCLYVKSEKRKKKINQLDQIDKEFKKKQMVLTARKWVPKKRKDKNNSLAEIKSEIIGFSSEGKPDPIRAIQHIFEEHNKEALQSKKGRLIRIPKIILSRDIF